MSKKTLAVICTAVLGGACAYAWAASNWTPVWVGLAVTAAYNLAYFIGRRLARGRRR